MSREWNIDRQHGRLLDKLVAGTETSTDRNRRMELAFERMARMTRHPHFVGAAHIGEGINWRLTPRAARSLRYWRPHKPNYRDIQDEARKAEFARLFLPSSSKGRTK